MLMFFDNGSQRSPLNIGPAILAAVITGGSFTCTYSNGQGNLTDITAVDITGLVATGSIVFNNQLQACGALTLGSDATTYTLPPNVVDITCGGSAGGAGGNLSFDSIPATLRTINLIGSGFSSIDNLSSSGITELRLGDENAVFAIQSIGDNGAERTALLPPTLTVAILDGCTNLFSALRDNNFVSAIFSECENLIQVRLHDCNLTDDECDEIVTLLSDFALSNGLLVISGDNGVVSTDNLANLTGRGWIVQYNA